MNNKNQKQLWDIPDEIFDNPAQVTGSFEVGVSTTQSASPDGEQFLSIGNSITGRSVARISRFDAIDREDLGIAYLFAAAPKLRAALESFTIGNCFCHFVAGEHTPQCEAALEALNDANGDDCYED